MLEGCKGTGGSIEVADGRSMRARGALTRRSGIVVADGADADRAVARSDGAGCGRSFCNLPHGCQIHISLVEKGPIVPVRKGL